jgi:GntR family transcriptional repressor for pyruvate dehydrogenase complex
MSNELSPIRKVNVSDEVSNRILKLIRENVFKPGEKILSEREFCEQFEVSRTSIREAISGLTSMRVLEKRSDGTYVREKLTDLVVEPMNLLFKFRLLSIEEVFEARIATESQIVRIAAKKATEEDMAKLEACLNADAASRSQYQSMSDRIRFHQLIAESTRNQVLIDMFVVMYSVLNSMRNNENTIRDAHTSNIQHREIFEKIKAHDEDGAEQEMRNHLSTMQVSYKKS